MKNIFAVNTNTYHGFTVDQALEGIAAAGFKNIEIATVRSWTEHIMPEYEEAEIARIAKKAADLGLHFVGMSGHCYLMDAERLEDFKKNMALAHRLGAKTIVSSTGEAHFGKDEKFADDVLIENITTLLPLLEEYDMTLCLETHGEYGTGESLYRIAQGVGSHRVGVCYDTANVVFYGGVHPEEEIKACPYGVKFVHLKDKIGYDNVWNFPAVGSGELKLLDVIEYLNSRNFYGPFSMEVEYTGDFATKEKTEEDLVYVNAQVKSAYEYLASKGLV